IMFLRDINVPIEDIKDILDNKVTFQDVLENHIEKVNTEIESLQYIKNMCKDLKEKNIPLLDQVIEDN
ncbi:MerR family transcriptional regulator, partial [Faecalibacillus intestinalis]